MHVRTVAGGRIFLCATKHTPRTRANMEAPSFNHARQELYSQLVRYTFGRVVRCTVPPDGQTRVGDQVTVTYFHGLATKTEHRPQPPGSRPVKLWFKKPPPDSPQRPLVVGPLTLDPADDHYVPRPGDSIVGHVVPSDGGGGGRRRPGVPPPHQAPGEEREQNDRFTYWHPHAACLENLLNFLFNGTALPEAQLAHELRSRKKGGEDDVWAVARLILFGNVRAFADQHLGVSTKLRPMRLSTPPLDFVWKCATKLDDESIWMKFKELVPDAQPPQEQLPLPAPTPVVVAPLFGASSNFEPPMVHVGRTRRAAAAPSYPSYAAAPPPPPPVYADEDDYGFGAYTPQSPGYTPRSPTYSPHAPPGGGASAQQQRPYSPSDSPPYCPTTPPYQSPPTPPPYQHPPLTPPYHPNPQPYPAVPSVSAESVLKLLQRVDSMHAPPPPRSFSPPHD